MVVIDRFSKYNTFIIVLTDCTIEEEVYHFIKNVVKY